MERGIAVVIILTLFLGGVTHLSAQRKSTYVGLGLSLGAPVAVFGISALTRSDDVFYVGMIVAPSAGHFYAHQWSRGLMFSSLRAGFAGLGYLTYIDLFIIGAAVITIIDIVSVPESVRQYNESLLSTGKVHIMPQIDPQNERYGISLVYCF
ncbi:hypothetical protein AMJ87_08285 [candidate division WOR_3 bacterium SM23_60]|uniref:Uncharacterized protein n=1 Tax=candidate division WOR_3 bacterium SM23_60 TaxID=1703780 RepID=A0A0S8GCG0_UNCW3|nr:MAG: hypothetical protein AMJ87_08285 [candidate division WOR_3 bacterium SM23_60]